MDGSIQPHNQRPASVWSSGGAAYDEISRQIASALEHCEEADTVYYDRDGEAAWQAFVAGYGPTKALAASLDERRRDDLKRDFIAFHDKFATSLGISVLRQYLLTVGTRR
jgi:hypothetical protein